MNLCKYTQVHFVVQLFVFFRCLEQQTVKKPAPTPIPIHKNPLLLLLKIPSHLPRYLFPDYGLQSRDLRRPDLLHGSKMLQ